VNPGQEEPHRLPIEIFGITGAQAPFGVSAEQPHESEMVLRSLKIKVF